MLWGGIGVAGETIGVSGCYRDPMGGVGALGGVCAVVVLECSKKPMGGIGELWGRLGF